MFLLCGINTFFLIQSVLSYFLLVFDQLTFNLLCVLISTSSQLIMDLTESLKASEYLLMGFVPCGTTLKHESKGVFF